MCDVTLGQKWQSRHVQRGWRGITWRRSERAFAWRHNVVVSPIVMSVVPRLRCIVSRSEASSRVARVQPEMASGVHSHRPSVLNIQ
jgi:hypothetical protein